MDKKLKIFFSGEREQDPIHLVRCEFGNYAVIVTVDNENKFIGINEIIEKKEFYNFDSKEIKSTIDVHDYYFEK